MENGIQLNSITCLNHFPVVQNKRPPALLYVYKVFGFSISQWDFFFGILLNWCLCKCVVCMSCLKKINQTKVESFLKHPTISSPLSSSAITVSDPTPLAPLGLFIANESEIWETMHQHLQPLNPEHTSHYLMAALFRENRQNWKQSELHERNLSHKT